MALNTASTNGLPALPEAIPPDKAIWEVENTGRITRQAFEIAIGVLVGLAFVCAIGRLSIRAVTRRRLYVDDGFLIFALACLCGGTGILYKRSQIIYIEFALLRGMPEAYSLALGRMDDLLNQTRWQFAYLFLLWTTIFAIKFCFFAFFRPLMRNMSKSMSIYYRFSIAFTVICWLFLALQGLITCPYFGKEAEKCFPDLPVSKSALLALFWIGPALDGITDIMIVSIPIKVLRMSQMKISAKVGLGSFMCLSLFMIVCSILRAAGTYYHGTLDFPWQVFWLHSEACIAVMMASITIFRTALIGHRDNDVGSSSIFSYLIKFRNRLWPSKRSAGSDELTDKSGRPRTGHWKLPGIPSATMTGLRTLFGGNSRTQQDTTGTDSALDLIETDYHAHVKGPEPIHVQRSWEMQSYYRTDSGARTAGKPSSKMQMPRKAADPPETREESLLLSGREQMPYTSGLAMFLLSLAGHEIALHHRTIGTGKLN